MGVEIVFYLLSAIEPLASAYETPLFEHSRSDVKGQDLSPLFYSYLKASESPLTPEDLKELQKFKVIIVPGFLSDVGSGFKSKVSKMLPWLFKNKDPQAEWLKSNGIIYEHVDIESEASPAVNAPAIQRAIEQSDRPVLLLSHSKGGLDILEALVHDLGLLKKVHGWIPIQAPFYGTPVSDVWTQKPEYRKTADRILKSLGGSVESLLSMRMQDRLLYMQRFAPQIAEVAATIPIVSFGGHAHEVKGRWDTVFEPYFRDQLEAARIESDGIVPWRNTILPEGSFVVGQGVDHLMPIGSIDFTSFDRVRFLQSMLKVLIHKASLN